MQDPSTLITMELFILNNLLYINFSLTSFTLKYSLFIYIFTMTFTFFYTQLISYHILFYDSKNKKHWKLYNHLYFSSTTYNTCNKLKVNSVYFNFNVEKIFDDVRPTNSWRLYVHEEIKLCNISCFSIKIEESQSWIITHPFFFLRPLERFILTHCLLSLKIIHSIYVNSSPSDTSFSHSHK